MAIRYLLPRIQNHSSRVDLFMLLWDTPLTEQQQEEIRERIVVKQERSLFGNLNNEGTPYSSLSCLVTRFHPNFESVIEPGVRQLLAAIAIDLDLVTYTSCEGHHYLDAPQRSDERHVGIIPRSAEEGQRALALFESAAASTNELQREAAAEVAIMRHTVVDGEVVYPAIDLYVCKHDRASWASYFADLDAVCNTLTEELLARASGIKAP